MAQQIINIGSAPNDGTGDQLRISFDKCNLNFTELYDGVTASLPIGNAIQYQFNNSAAEPPSAGEIRLNNATQASATKLWASHTTSSGINIKQFLSAATSGSSLILQDKNDNTNYLKLNVAGAPVDKTTYWEFPVAVTASGGNLPNAAILAAVTAAAGGGGGNVSNSGTPTNGQFAQWTDATHIQGVAASTITTGFAPLASPTFTGDPKAPTPTAGDNDTSIATTAFVTAAVAAAGGGSSSITAPQGRLTLQTATPVMTTTQSAKTTIFYTPYIGQLVPLFNGTSFTMTDIGGELSQLTTDTTKSPAAVAANQVYDIFVWDDAGTKRATRGPTWASGTGGSNTVRGTGSGSTELVRVQGILLNANAITNGPAAQRGTYIGTIATNGSSQVDWIYGTAAIGGGMATFGVWNAYNRVGITTQVIETTSSWIIPGGVIRAAQGSNSNRVNYVCGLSEDNFIIDFTANTSYTSSVDFGIIGIGYDTTTGISGIAVVPYTASSSANGFGSATATFVTTSLGFHFMQACERLNSGATQNAIVNGVHSGVNLVGLSWQGRM